MKKSGRSIDRGQLNIYGNMTPYKFILFTKTIFI